MECGTEKQITVTSLIYEFFVKRFEFVIIRAASVHHSTYKNSYTCDVDDVAEFLSFSL